MRHYHAGINTPGYLPESQPERFESSDDAWSFLGSELKNAWDNDYGWQDLSDDEKLAIDHRYLGPAGEIHNHPQGPGGVMLDGPTETHLGWVYWVTECTEDCPEEE